MGERLTMTEIGFRRGVFLDESRPHWRDGGARPVSWVAWYPVDSDAQSAAPGDGFFDLGDVCLDAPLADNGPHPVVLLSHGTGGSADSLGWLARALVAAGYVVLAPNHHGNSGGAPYLAEGFLCWWERSTDLTFLLDRAAEQGPFAGRLDLSHVKAVGFSLGGYNALALAGARTDMDMFESWRATNAPEMRGPREFEELNAEFDELMATSLAFRASWARHGDDYRDHRVSGVVAIAPAPVVRALTEASLKAIDLPCRIISGGDDQEAPNIYCGDWLCQVNPAFARFDMGDAVGHYTFVNLPKEPARIKPGSIFSDAPGVDRKKVQNATACLVIEGLRA